MSRDLLTTVVLEGEFFLVDPSSLLIRSSSDSIDKEDLNDKDQRRADYGGGLVYLREYFEADESLRKNV